MINVSYYEMGDRMKDNIWEESIGTSLRFIVNSFGKNALLNSNEVNAMLNELVPDSSKEANWIKEAIDLGIVEILLEKKNIDDYNRNIAINKIRVILKENYTDEDRINFIVDNLAYGLGWSNTKEGYNIEDEENKEDDFNENIDEQHVNNDNLNKENDKNQSNINNQNQDNIDSNQDNSDSNEDNSESNKNNIDWSNIISNNIINEDIDKTNSTNDANSKDSEDNEDNEDIKSDDNTNPDENINSKKKKYKIIISVIILLILGCIGVGVYNHIKSNRVYVKDITFNIAYKKEDSKYIFKKGDFIVMNISLKGENSNEIDENKLRYKVDDTSICNISNEFNKCRITGRKVGETKIHIYYKRDKIESIDIKFRN